MESEGSSDDSGIRVETKRKRIAKGKYACPYRCAMRDFPAGCGPLAGLSFTASTNSNHREGRSQIAETIGIAGPECSGSSSESNPDKIRDLEEEVCSHLEVSSGKQAYMSLEEEIALNLRVSESSEIRTSNPKDVQGKGNILIGIIEGRSLQSNLDKIQDQQEEASSRMEVPFNMRDRSHQEVVPHDLNVQMPTAIIPSDSELPSQNSVRTVTQVTHPKRSIGLGSDASGIRVKAKRDFPDGCGPPRSLSFDASTNLNQQEGVPPVAESIAIAGPESIEGSLEINPEKNRDRQEGVSSDMEVSLQKQAFMSSKEEVPFTLTVTQVSRPRRISAVRSFPEGCGRQAVSGCAEVKSNSADMEASGLDVQGVHGVMGYALNGISEIRFSNPMDVQRKGSVLIVSSNVEEVLSQKQAFMSAEEVAYDLRDSSHKEVVSHDSNVQTSTKINPFDSELPSQKATVQVDSEVLTQKAMDPLKLGSPTQKQIVQGLMASTACPWRQRKRVCRRL